MKRFVLAAFVAGMALAVLLAVSQTPFADARFEYGVYRVYEGTLVRDPFPVLRTTQGALPLVGAGKWSAARDLSGAAGFVSLRAAVIQRGAVKMLEVEPGSVRPGAGEVAAGAARPKGLLRVQGEIVDSKCYLGVMNPGAGKTHRACAARCLHGGVPPALATLDGRLIWLRSGGNLSEYAGDRVVVTGEMVSAGALEFLSVTGVMRVE